MISFKRASAWSILIVTILVIMARNAERAGSFLGGLVAAVVSLVLAALVFWAISVLVTPVQGTWYVYVEREDLPAVIFGPYLNAKIAGLEKDCSPVIKVFREQSLVRASILRFNPSEIPSGFVRISYNYSTP